MVEKNLEGYTRPNYFLQSSRIRVDLLSYESKRTDKREQYDWRAEKNLDGYNMKERSCTLCIAWMKNDTLISACGPISL